MKKNYALIDIFKLFFAIGIVALHAKVFDITNTIIWLISHCIFKLGVIYFFCVSGFFLAKKLSTSTNIKDNIKKYIKRLSIPLIFWLIIDYYPLKLHYWIANFIIYFHLIIYIIIEFY